MYKYKSIGEERPHLIDYFVNKEEAFKYSLYSSKKVNLICPLCHKEREMTISKLTIRGFNCGYCSENISYPNRYLRAFIGQLDVDNYIFEYSPDWLLGKRYDGYIKKGNKEYVIEMDGRQHSDKEYFGKTLEEQRRIDKLKDNLAVSHNIIMVRIDCRCSEPNYIREQICKSILSKNFNLSCIDWDLCGKEASKNTTKKIVDYYNSHKDMSSEKIADELHLHFSTVIRHLKKASSVGMCDYNIEEAKEKGKKQSIIVRNSNREPFDVIDNNGNYVGRYQTINACLKDLRELYPNLKFYQGLISNMGLGTKSLINGFSFKYVCGLEEFYKDNILMHNVIEYYNCHKEMTNNEIGEMFNIHKDTVRKFLIAGDKLKLCDYKSSDRLRLAQQRSSQAKKKIS